jgi:integrase|tara:strand:- start:271 stop:834 length:564 start_codon:yes stop_codon:yes gene_type:complete
MTVEPIRNKKKIKEFYDCLLDNSDRNALMFKLGINTILRVSDLIRLKVSSVYTPEMKPREHLCVKEKKTGKMTKIKLHPDVLSLLIDYIKRWGLIYDDWLFFSYNTPSNHIDRTIVWRFLKKASIKCGFQGIGTHTMRKTRAYHVYQKTKDIYHVMELLNHQSPRYTMRYIGITQSQKDRTQKEIIL